MAWPAFSDFCCMKILLCAATEMEIAPMLQFLSKGNTSGVTVLITGVGLLSATFALTKAVAASRPELVIQAGVAGSLDQTLPLASVVAIKAEAVGDSGVMEDGRFRTPFDLKLIDSKIHPWTDGKLLNGNPLLQSLGLPLVHGVTVNEISTSAERIAYYRHQLATQVESMEGAALHYVALREDLAFLQLRSVSNFIGERDKTKWQMAAAIKNLNAELQRILKTLSA